MARTSHTDSPYRERETEDDDDFVMMMMMMMMMMIIIIMTMIANKIERVGSRSKSAQGRELVVRFFSCKS